MSTEKFLAIAIAILTDLNPSMTSEQIEKTARFGLSVSPTPCEYITALYEQAGICR